MRLLLICGIALLIAPAALASGSSVAVNNPYPIHVGDTVTFSYSTNVANPVIRLFCSDGRGDGVTVPSMEGPASSAFTLATTYPSGATIGDGFCRADLGSYNNHGSWKRVAWQQLQFYAQMA